VSAPVLVAYDPVGRDRAPVRFGASVAAFTGAPLLVASAYASEDVVELLAGGQMGEELPRDPGAALAEVAQEAGSDGRDVETLALGATSAPSALDLAAVEVGAGVLVVGSAASGRPGRVEPGSTAIRLLNGGPCAVAVVPRDWELDSPLTGFGAGYVDSPEGEATVRAGRALATGAGALLRILTAVRTPSWMQPNPGGGDLTEQLRHEAEDVAGSLEPAAPGVRVDVDVVVGDPADALLAASEELDLLLCGSRGYGPRPAVLLGGVTRRVTAGAACPVIVLAHGAEVSLEALIDES
jgi:nucleotide-binding universal stress UspA family protein